MPRLWSLLPGRYRRFRRDSATRVFRPQEGQQPGSWRIILISGDASATAKDLVFAIGGGKYGNFRPKAGDSKSGFTLGVPALPEGVAPSDTILKMQRDGNR